MNKAVTTLSFHLKAVQPFYGRIDGCPKAAEALRFSPTDLKSFGVVDQIVQSPPEALTETIPYPLKT